MFHRRHFLQTTAAATASLVIPPRLFARKTSRHCLVLHTDSGSSWSVIDHVVWALNHARDPVLERASQGLSKLTTDDGDRIIRLILRRCGLNLIEIHRPHRVIVQYWSQLGLADLRPFFKRHRLARVDVDVELRNRKSEEVETQNGEDFLFGDPLAFFFPLRLFLQKWDNRFEHQRDDWTAAPATWSGFAWEGVESNLIPWAALKSAWRRSTPLVCSNCDEPTILVNFGFAWRALLNRTMLFIYVCPKCRRSFEDDSVTDLRGWMKANLDPEVWPDYDMLWEKQMRRDWLREEA
jgi:hypothetical protein